MYFYIELKIELISCYKSVNKGNIKKIILYFIDNVYYNLEIISN